MKGALQIFGGLNKRAGRTDTEQQFLRLILQQLLTQHTV